MVAKNKIPRDPKAGARPIRDPRPQQRRRAVQSGIPSDIARVPMVGY